MALEPGGYADKLGNRYEGRWIVKQLLRILNEQLASITIETVGDDEAGVDMWVEEASGRRLAQQCKLRNGSKNQWTIADLNGAGVLSYMGYQLDRNSDVVFCLVTAISSTLLHDMCNSARKSSGDAESFYQHQIVGISQERQKAFSQFCKYLSLDPDSPDDRAVAYGYLSRIFIEHWPDTLVSQDDLRSDAQWLVNGDPDSVIANLSSYAENHLRKTIISEDVWNFLIHKGFSPRRLSNDCRVLPSIHALREQFNDSISSQLIANELIEREETKRSLDALANDGIVILHGRPGHGKSSVLYEITQQFEERGQVYLPLRLDRQEPRNTTLQFGQDIGLPESPVKCLSAISNGGVCTLILDQLDAIRWTYGHSKNALEVCKSLVREVMVLRGLGHPVSVILACRTYDLENDPDIKGWLGQAAQPDNRTLTKVEVGPLSDDVVKSIADKLKALPISDRQISILKSPQHMAMWVRLVSDGQRVEFFNRIQLMRRYWGSKMLELVKSGTSSEIVTSELSRIIKYMEDKGRISAPYSISTNSHVINELCACGLIQVASNQITFSHQSYLDFQIANNLVREIFIGSRNICDWLGDKSNQTLFHREQLRHVLSLLSEESPEEFFIETQNILCSENIRFNLKNLALEVLGQIESPDNDLVRYMLSLSEEDYWQEHVFRTVFLGHSAYISWLIEEKIIEQWLASEEKKDRALWLLRSISEKLPDQVAELLLPYLNDSAWHDRILECLNWDISDDSEKMFRIRTHLAKIGISREFVAWKKVSAERAIRLLEAVLQSYEPEDFTYDNHWELRNKNSRLENWSVDDLDVLLKASRDRSADIWDRIFPQLTRLVPQEDEGFGSIDLWLDSDDEGLRNGRECLPGGIVKLCLEAGKELAKDDGDAFWVRTQITRKENSKIIKYILVTIYSHLDLSLADKVLDWLISYVPNFSVGAGGKEPKWMPAARLIGAMSSDCSTEIFDELERKITYFKEDNFLNHAEYWVSTWRKGYYGSYWGEAQYFLLPSLCENRRSAGTDDLIAVLSRKFEDYDKEDFLSGIKSRGGTVTSTIPRDRLKRISDQAWLEIIGNKKIPEDDGLNFRVRDDGVVRETSVTYFSRDLEYVVKRSPDRFARLALRFPKGVSPKYKSAVIEGLKETRPKDLSEAELDKWLPADHELVLKVLEKFSGENKSDFPLRFCWFIHHRSEEKWPEKVIRELFEYATSHSDPEPGKLNIGDSGGGFNSDESTIRNLESNAINCVRGVSAQAIAQLLWSHDELLDSIKPVLECLIEDEHPAVRIASLDILLPVTNFDKDYAVGLFVRAIKGDFRVAASRFATYLFNSCMKSHFQQLYPVVIGMLHDSRDEVVERGAHEVAARWLFHDFFSAELDSCISGSEPQRKGIARIAAYFIKDASFFEKCKILMDRLKGDESKEVRKELVSIFRKSELFDSSQGVEFLIDFIDSPAFSENLTLLLYRLEDYSGNLLPFANLLLSIGGHFTRPSLVSNKGGGSDYAQDIHHYMPLMVRLYEQAKSLGRSDIEQMCLDIWDGMYEKQVGSVHEISRIMD